MILQSEHRVDKIITRAAFAQIDFKPLAEKAHELIEQFVRTPNRHVPALHEIGLRERRGEKRAQWQTQIVFEDERDNAKCRTAQTVRILAACRLFVNR